MNKKHWCAAGIIGVIAVVALIRILDVGSWASLDMNKLTNLSQTTVIYDAKGELVTQVHNGQNRVMVSITDIPEHVKNAFIAMEDARFYQHPGVDVLRIGGAILNNIKAGGYQEGGSTITQQLIKLTHLTSEKKISRKLQEAWLALQLERIAEKDEILEMYLNTVYFGKGAYGIEAAAQTYFGISCKELTLSQGALLAGIIKAPGKYAPHIDLEKALQRRTMVLNAMLREGKLTQSEKDAANQEQVILIDSADTDYGWYVDWALTEAAQQLGIGAEELLSGGYRIYSALDQEMQQICDDLFEQPDFFPADASDGVQTEAALIAIHPATGEILCMAGGRNYDTRHGLNRAMQIKRQPGSAFKPISVYAAAVDYLGYTPVSLIQDTERDFGNGYTPSNASGNSYGTVTLREALKRSMNLATVDLMTRTGIQSAKTYAERAGISLTEQDNNLSLALGALTEGVSPAELCAAYAPLANGGYRVRPHAVNRIENLYGEVLYQWTDDPAYVMSDKSARMLTDMLEETVRGGTARALNRIGFPVAAKTGTVGSLSGGNRDIWTVAYTPSISVAVWQGFDQPDETHLLCDGVTGGSYPARLAAAFLQKTKYRSDGGKFPIPEGMSTVLLDDSLLISDGIIMLASENTPSSHILSEILPVENQPTLVSDRWNHPKPVEAVYVQSNADGEPVISFIAPDSGAQYLIMRVEDGKQTEVGCIEGAAGTYLTFTDQTNNRSSAAYFVVSRHKAFYEEGITVLSDPSETVVFHAPGLLERLMLGKTDLNDETSDALFDLDAG